MLDPKAAACVRNDGKVKWNLDDLNVATVEELNPEGAMEIQNLRSLGMGWARYVNDLSKYLPDAETLADMSPAEDETIGVFPDVPRSHIHHWDLIALSLIKPAWAYRAAD